MGKRYSSQFSEVVTVLLKTIILLKRIIQTHGILTLQMYCIKEIQRDCKKHMKNDAENINEKSLDNLKDFCYYIYR